MSSLNYLELGKTRLSGSLPATIYSPNLNNLLLYDSLINGTLGPEVGLMAGLASLQLSGNSLSGRIPSEVGNLTSLVYLDLSSNSLRGTVPAQIGKRSPQV